MALEKNGEDIVPIEWKTKYCI